MTLMQHSSKVIGSHRGHYLSDYLEQGMRRRLVAQVLGSSRRETSLWRVPCPGCRLCSDSPRA